jgi:hypothetical protein
MRVDQPATAGGTDTDSTQSSNQDDTRKNGRIG